MNMKLTSLNLAGYKDWPQREQMIVEYFDSIAPDMLFLQEVKFDASVSALNQAKLINSKLKVGYPYVQVAISRIYLASDGTEAREGLAVLSKYPIRQSEILVLNKHDDDKHTRIIQNVDVDIEGKVTGYTNVHLSNNQYAKEQLEELLKILTKRNEERIIVGDFNISDLTVVNHLFESKYISSAEFTEYVSYPSENARFDYVLLPKTYRYTSMSIGEGLSDHNSLTLEVAH